MIVEDLGAVWFSALLTASGNTKRCPKPRFGSMGWTMRKKSFGRHGMVFESSLMRRMKEDMICWWWKLIQVFGGGGMKIYAIRDA